MAKLGKAGAFRGQRRPQTWRGGAKNGKGARAARVGGNPGGIPESGGLGAIPRNPIKHWGKGGEGGPGGGRPGRGCGRGGAGDGGERGESGSPQDIRWWRGGKRGNPGGGRAGEVEFPWWGHGGGKREGRGPLGAGEDFGDGGRGPERTGVVLGARVWGKGDFWSGGGREIWGGFFSQLVKKGLWGH